MHSAAVWPRPAVRGTRPVSERGQSPPAPRPAQGKCPAGRSRPRRQTAGAGSLISPDGIVSEEGLLSHKRTRTTAAMLVTGAAAILPCSHSAGNSQPPARRMRNAAPCPWTAKAEAVAETSSTVQKHPWTIMDTGWRRHTPAGEGTDKGIYQLMADVGTRASHRTRAPGSAWLTAARTGRCGTGLPLRSGRSRCAASARSPSPLARPRAARRRARAAGPGDFSP